MSNKSDFIKDDFASTLEAFGKMLEKHRLSIDDFESHVQDFEEDLSAITLNTKKISEKEYDNAIPLKISEILSNERSEMPQILSTLSSTMDSYLEHCLEMSFFKDYRKLRFGEELCPYPDANSTATTRERFKALLTPYIKEPISFLNYINKIIKKHIMVCLLIELTFKYDCTETIDENAPEKEEIKLSISDIFNTYKDLSNGAPGINTSRTSAWRLQNELHSFFNTCQSINFRENADRLLAEQKEYHCKGLANHPDFNFRYDYRKVFSLYNYASLNLIFAPLSCDTENIPFAFPLSFVAYTGFVVHQFSKARNLYSHCETYKRNLDTGNTHNTGRDFLHIQKKYNAYIDEVNVVIQNMLLTHHPLNSEQLCAEFLLEKSVLHHRFFASLDSEIFHYIAAKIDTSSAEESSSSTNYYYTLLKVLWYFDIDLEDLYDCAFSPEEYFACEGLESITDSDNPLGMPLAFLCDYLKEIYYNRGELLADGISIFNSVFQELGPVRLRERINSLSNYIYTNYKSSETVTPSAVKNRTPLSHITFSGFSDKELQLIVHMLHLSGTEDLMI